MKFNKNQQVSRLKLFNDVDKNWPFKKGKESLLKFLSQAEVTRKEAMDAQCYQCCNGYKDGVFDCESAVCSLYQYMPYRTAKAREARPLNEEQREALAERFRIGREKKERERNGIHE